MNAYRSIGAALLALALLACTRTHTPSHFDVRDGAGSGAGGTDASHGDTLAGNTTSSDADHARPGTGGADAAGSASNRDEPTGGSSATAEAGASMNAAGDDVGRDSPQRPGDGSNTPNGTGNVTKVWAGELWSVAHALCDPNAPWRDTPLVEEPMGYIDRSVLILELGVDSSLRGLVRLGEGTPPGDPGDVPYADGDSGSFWLCSWQLPTKGIEYTLLSATLTSDRLMFEIDVGETWNSWCATQSRPCPGSPDGGCSGFVEPGPVCECDAGQCTGGEQNHVRFDLKVTPDTIEGELPFGGTFGTPAQLRLLRVER